MGGYAKPKLALKIIRYVFRHPVNREILIKKNRQQVHELKETLRKFVDELENYLPSADATQIDINNEHLLSNQTYLCEVLQSLLTLTILLHSSNNGNIESGPTPNINEKKAKKTNTSTQHSADNTNEVSGQAETDIFIVLDELLEWAEKNLITLPQINSDTFSLRLLNSLINACSNTVTLRIADINFIGISLEFAKNVLDSINLENLNNLTSPATDTIKEGDDESVKVLENIISAKIKPICRLMREITEWFFESQTYSLQYHTKENIDSQNATKDDVEVSKVITMAVPILFEKIFGIIHQIYGISKEKNLNIQTSLDNMKKLFASILQLYEI